MEESSTASGLTRMMEELAGHPIDAGSEEFPPMFFIPVATWQIVENGNVTTRKKIQVQPDTPPACSPTALLDVCGVASTEANGRQTLLLSHFVCQGRGFTSPINVVVTPRAPRPFFATVMHTLTASQDVEITVFTWDASGAPAPGVVVDWRCQVPLTQISI
jgi:hypothetical protein